MRDVLPVKNLMPYVGVYRKMLSAHEQTLDAVAMISTIRAILGYYHPVFPPFA